MWLPSALRWHDLLLGPLNVCLQVHQRVEDRLWAWWTSRDVHIDRDNLIDARYGGIIIVESTRGGARAERDNPFGFSHLLVDSKENGGEFVIHGTNNPQQVGLARGKSG